MAELLTLQEAFGNRALGLRSFNVDALPLAIDPFVRPIDLGC